MTTRRLLRIDDLVAGLEAYDGRYEAIDVFADDVQELRSAEAISGLRALDENGHKFLLSPAGRTKSYVLELFPDAGVLRLSIAPSRSSNPGTGAALGGLAGTAIGAAATKKGEGAAAGLLLGLLVGAALGAASDDPSRPQRVFTLRFDPDAMRWQAYDGGLVRWMKQELLPRPVRAR